MSERFSEAFLQDLKDRLPITDLIGNYVSWDNAKSNPGRRDMWACCPFHGEHTPSFHAEDAEQLYHCFGCGAHGDHYRFLTEGQGLSFPDAVEVVAGLAGVPLPDRPDAPRPPRQAPEPKPAERPQPRPASGEGRRVIYESYPYPDADGNLLYEVCRMQILLPDGTYQKNQNGQGTWKTFLQRRPSRMGDGSWVWGLSDGEFMRPGPGKDWRKFDAQVFADWQHGERAYFGDAPRHTIFRHPEVEIAIAEGREIFLPEGEKDVKSIVGWELEGSTNSGGGKHWTPALAQLFRDADVIIPMDNDEVGREAAERKARSLRGIARRIRVLDLAPHWPGMPVKADITDWRDNAGGTREKLLEIVAQLPDWRPAAPTSRFRAFRIGDIGRADLRHQWLVDGILELMGTTALIGPSQSGKSFLVIELAFAVALGKPFWGREVKQGLVFYQMGEGEQGVAKRVEGYLKYHGIDKGADVPLVLLPKKVNLFVDDKDTDELIAECKAWADHVGQPIRLLVIDTLNKAITGANEISGQDMGKVIARIERIKDELQCTVLLVHHMNAGGNRIRGHSSLVADLTNVIEVQPLELHDENGRIIRSMKLDKNKDGEGKLTHRFVLRQVILDPASDGKQRDTCVIDRPAGTDESGRKEYSLTKAEREAYDALLKVLNEAGQPVPHGVAVPRDVTNVVGKGKWSAEVRNKFQFTPEDSSLSPEEQQAKWTKEFNTAFVRMARNLQHAGIIGNDNAHGVVWWTKKPIQGYKRAESKASTTPPLPADVKSELSGMEDIPF